MASAPLPELLRVTACVGLVVPMACAPNVMFEAERLTTGAVPIPLIAAFCVPVSSTIVIVAFLLPATPGVKVTLMAQVEPAPTLAPQLFVWEKSALLAPITLMLVTFRAMLPLFERVRLCTVEGVPTA